MQSLGFHVPLISETQGGRAGSPHGGALHAYGQLYGDDFRRFHTDARGRTHVRRGQMPPDYSGGIPAEIQAAVSSRLVENRLTTSSLWDLVIIIGGQKPMVSGTLRMIS